MSAHEKMPVHNFGRIRQFGVAPEIVSDTGLAGSNGETD